MSAELMCVVIVCTVDCRHTHREPAQETKSWSSCLAPWSEVAYGCERSCQFAAGMQWSSGGVGGVADRESDGAVAEVGD